MRFNTVTLLILISAQTFSSSCWLRINDIFHVVRFSTMTWLISAQTFSSPCRLRIMIHIRFSRLDMLIEVIGVLAFPKFPGLILVAQ